jgi:hypothetical protein
LTIGVYIDWFLIGALGDMITRVLSIIYVGLALAFPVWKMIGTIKIVRRPRAAHP